MHNLLVVLEKGKVTDVKCCANGTDSSHALIRGRDYSVLDVDKLNANQDDWLIPKVYKGEKDQEQQDLKKRLTYVAKEMEQCLYCHRRYHRQDMIWAEPEMSYVCLPCFRAYWNI